MTPKTFISFLNTYKVTYVDQKDKIDVLAVRMATGLNKLVEAQVTVDEMRQDLAIKEQEMAVASEAAEKVMKNYII